MLIVGVWLAALLSEVCTSSMVQTMGREYPPLSKGQQQPPLLLPDHIPVPKATSVSLYQVFYQDLTALVPMPSCGMEGECHGVLSAGSRNCGIGIRVAIFPPEFCSASMMLFEEAPKMAAAFLEPLPIPPGHLCVTRSSLFPGHSFPRSHNKAWHGKSQARVFTQFGLGSVAEQQPQVQSFLCPVGKPAVAHSS